MKDKRPLMTRACACVYQGQKPRKRNPTLRAAKIVLLALVCLAYGTVGHWAAAAPTVNGLFYGDGDNANYPSTPYAISDNGSEMYVTLQAGTLHVALVVNRGINDAVWSPTKAYTQSAGWTPPRKAKAAMDSEFAAFTLTVGEGANEQSWAWQQGSGGVAAGAISYTNENWISDETVAGGLGTPPPNLVSSSSFAWNMSNYAVRVNADIDPGWDMGDTNSWEDWTSPITNPGDPNNVINAAEGYPSTGTITYSSTYEWEWSMVYEWSIDLTAYGKSPVFVVTGSSHHSPAKNGLEDDPFPPGTGDPLRDFGDLPAVYPTTLSNNAACHVIDVSGAYLGTNVDSEVDGLPGPYALGDDLDTGNDEDGVELLTSMLPGSNATIRVTVGAPGALSAFIDFDQDGVLDQVTLVSASGPSTLTPGVIGDMTVTNGVYDLTISVPSSASNSMPARFRITNEAGEGGNSPGGEATSGEVEDYIFQDYKPTLARLSEFGAILRGDVVVAQWRTASERGTMGYYLERMIADGSYVRINTDLILAENSPGGAFYEQPDADAPLMGALTYRLVEIEVNGGVRYLGPFTVVVGGPTRSLDEWSRSVFSIEELADPSISDPDADPDGDGLTNYQEYLAGTSPTSAASVLRVSAIHPDTDGGTVVHWLSEEGRLYILEISTNQLRSFEPLIEGVPATPPVNQLTDPVPRGPSAHYRVRLVAPVPD